MSGYANRFKEMLQHLHRAGDTVQVMTTDDVPDAPTKFLDFPVRYTPGFRFPLYKHICLTFDVKMAAYHFLKAFRPQIMHVATPGFFCFAAIIYARLLRIPLIFSYHTHLPIYARCVYSAPFICHSFSLLARSPLADHPPTNDDHLPTGTTWASCPASWASPSSWSAWCTTRAT